MSYVELHCHSAFSFLDGASLPEELVAAALDRGHETLALTDHNTVSGSMEFAQAASSLGLRAVHGAEIDLVDAHTARERREGAILRDEEREACWSRHVTLLVRDATGWRNLCRLLTRAHAHTRDTPGRRRVLGPLLTIDDLAEHAEGLVCLSGCADHGVHDEPTARALLAVFGRDAFRVELQRPFHRDDRARNRELADLAGRLGVPCVATGNVHAHEPARARLQDAFVAIAQHTTLDASEPLRRGNHTHVLASPAAMAARFEDHPDAVAESARLAATLRFDLTADLGYRYPGAEDAAADRKLAKVCASLFDGRYPSGSALRAEATARLEQELKLIRTLDLSGFFLLHHEMLELAREVAAEVRGGGAARGLMPPGRGRGSSVSSIVCYLTGLSHIDPIANDLFLGRFLNEEITALPDIDLDFPRDVRAVLIPRVHERFGPEKSALVAAFPTYRARGAIRELGKALGLPPGEIERVARSSEAYSAQTVDHDIAVALGEGRVKADPPTRWRWLADLSSEAHGLPRHLSQHSGGMVVATRPLIDCCPVVPAAMEGRQMVMWDKDSCSDAGFLKIDLLGLGMLSAVERCVEMVHARRGERIDLSRIPMDDKATFECIQNAETTGVFQIESRAQMGSLRRTRPETLQDLTIQVAIVRPGPIVGGAINPYIERLQRLRADPTYEVPYEHPSLKEILADTLGTIIFQDQVIEVAMSFAGFSPGEAEGLRRAMSRKRSDAAIEAYRDRFVRRAMTRWDDVDEDLAQRIWDMVKGFSGFGFPKAHGAAFGLLAYQSTWLRVHYGTEFLASLLDEQPMGFYPPDSLVHEAQRRGIVVLPPDVNASAVECTVVDADEAGTPGVRIGLGYVMGVREDDVTALVAAREEAGAFRTIEDLASRAGAGRAALEQLAWSGACDALADGARRRALWELGVAAPGKRLLTSVVGASGRRLRTDHGTQLALPLDVGAAPALAALTGWEAMIADYTTTGLTTSTHPLGLLRDELQAKGMVTSGDLSRLRHGSPVRIGGLVVARQRPGTAKGVCFMLLEDETGTVNLVVPPNVYERDRTIVRAEPLVVAEGVLERHASAGGAINVVCHRLARLDATGHLSARPAADVATPHLTSVTGGSTDPLAADVVTVKDFSMLDAIERARQDARGAAEADDATAPASTPRAAPTPLRPAAVEDDDDLAATGTDDFRAVAPAVQSFASGRRR
ncbi:MAG TPA: DNA polymerase III subunit alpha [Baekduia sp.]|uniref:DNA polymerase III subunit alpha n=1 Tax=Baekduia sp. TaxID=2600305 RepID=UPI002D77B06E|nr:DNA polymerase III subunit alpha [Baekduia sp.]HET6505720.1 DNA polymerase III subunit alpha [Baekduia sp.]